MKLSIIEPTLNEENAIERTLHNLRQLVGVSYELIVADSGSTDRTVEIARLYADKVLQYNDLPQNAARGRNLGASASQAEFLAFVDADVTITNINAFFEKALAEFEECERLVAIATRIEVASETRTFADWLSYRIANASIYVINNVLGLGIGSGELQMVRADAFARARGYNEQFTVAEDADLYAKLARLGTVRMLPTLLVEHPGRRPHAIGWPKLWRQWIVNLLSLRLLGYPWDNEWSEIR